MKRDLFSFGLHFLPQLMLLEKMNVSLPDALCFALLTSLLLSPLSDSLLCSQQSRSASVVSLIPGNR